MYIIILISYKFISFFTIEILGTTKMPASSRKRNKGKERKAKQATKKVEAQWAEVNNTWHDWARGDMTDTFSIQCKHGFDEVVLPDESHPVSSFISSFCLTSLKDTILNHSYVKNDESLRKMTTDILTMIGTNLLYATDEHGEYMQFIISIILAITILENYDEELDYDSNSINPIALVKNRDLCDSSPSVRRDLLKFFRKRITCSCLKKKHLETRKTQPKVGRCFNCEVVKDRSLLMVCSRCMVAPYCSRECQVLDSPRHREYCDKYVRVRKQQTHSNDTI